MMMDEAVHCPNGGQCGSPSGTGALMIADGAAGHGIVMHSFDGAPPRFFLAPAASIGSYMSRDGSGIYFYAFPGPGSSQVQLLPLSQAPSYRVAGAMIVLAPRHSRHVSP